MRAMRTCTELTTPRYAHGLTPPMHWVRRRRFRPRISYRRIEEIEAEVEKLLDQDRRSCDTGGSVEYSVLDADAVSSEEEEEEEMEDAPHYIEAETPMADVDDNDMNGIDLEQALAAGLMADDDDDDEEDGFAAAFAEGLEQAEAGTPATAHDVAMHALGDDAAPPIASPASTSHAETESADDDDDDDADDDNDEDPQATEAAKEQQADVDETQERIREIQSEIDAAWKQYHAYDNVIFKNRCMTKINNLTADLNLAKGRLGEDED